MKRQRGWANIDLLSVFGLGLLVGATAGAIFATLLFVLVPQLWALLKPWLHGATA